MAIRSLTQAEAERRAALLAVERYDVEVDLTDLVTGPEVRCVSTVTFACHEPGSETFVDCAAEVVAASLNGVPLAPPVDGRLALSDLAARNVLRVESVQSDTRDGQGVHRAVDPADGEVYLWTSFEPDEARFVWACFDQPDLKAPHAFTVTAPAAWTVLTNSAGAAVEEQGDRRVWTFPATPPLSTYNTVVNAGPLHEVRRGDLSLHARRSLARMLERDADALFDVAEQGLAFFAGVFGMPFPQREYQQVFMPEYGGAMENYGCVTWSDTFLHPTAPTTAEWQLFAKVLLHEMAHMWFGNIVTMRWWDDLWLNEAFAEFAANWASARATANVDAWAAHLVNGKLRAYLADQGPATHPIHQPIHDVAQAASIFDAITYPKGASVLHQLMWFVGEDAFVTGMTAYFARHAWGNTTLQDLIDALSAASGRDLTAWRDGWLTTAGTDRLALRRNGSGLALVADAAPRPQVVGVGAYVRDGTSLRRTALARVEVSTVSTPVDLPDADVYVVNDDDLTFATTRPLVAEAAQLPTAISRAVAVATAWDMLMTGESATADVVRLLCDVLAAETSASVVEPYLALAAEAIELWAPEADRLSAAATLVDTCRSLGGRPALRVLARVGDADALDTLAPAARDDVDLRWRVLARQAELGADFSGVLAELVAVDPDPDAWLRALVVRAAAPDAAAKEAVWQALVVDRTVPPGAVRAVTASFWRPGQDEILAPYAERYLTLLPDLHRGGMTPAMALSGSLFPVYGVDSSFLPRAAAAASGAAPVVSKTVTERSDVLSRMLRARSR